MIKKEELYSLIATENPDIIALSEILPKTSLLPNVKEYYNIGNYNRVISNIDKGHGVVFNIRSSFNPKAITFETLFEESMLCSLKLNTSDTMLVGCIYRSPNSTETNNVYLFYLSKEVSEKRYSHNTYYGRLYFSRNRLVR